MQRKRNVNPDPVNPSVLTPDVNPTPAHFGTSDCECLHCEVNHRTGDKLTINHGDYVPIHLLADNERNRVSLPGDVDYAGVVGVAV